jgi:hypothetical protein
LIHQVDDGGGIVFTDNIDSKADFRRGHTVIDGNGNGRGTDLVFGRDDIEGAVSGIAETVIKVELDTGVGN